jgi:PAS domain S-box-containing protein
MGAYLIPPHNHSINDKRTFPDSPLLQALQKIIEPLNKAVTVSSSDGFIIKANAAVETVYGWPLQDVIGSPTKKFCASEERENWENLAWNITEKISDNDQNT